MKYLFASINAKYIHTNLAIREVSQFCLKYDNTLSINIAEYTINQSEEYILKELYFNKSDVYIFSCYIWNISTVKSIISSLYKILPESKIFIAGPEATYKSESLYDELPFLSGIIVGEGERTTLELLNLIDSGRDYVNVDGLYTYDNTFSPRQPISLDELPFAYFDLESLGERILYYESMRGCPFSCSYCLSSVEKGVRFRSFELVTQDLKRFSQVRPRQVKFVDRTFNCNIDRAKQIWSYLIENDNGITNFHFELAGDLMDDESIEILSKARSGLFQFEIGIQSVNIQTLEEIDRKTNLEILFSNIKKLQKLKNIHLHLDLIAGLPYEDKDSFITSFNTVYSLKPDQFQLGFLKVLGGSKMEKMAQEYELKYMDEQPFEILKNKWISFEELSVLKDVAEMVEIYNNSNRYSYTIKYLFDTLGLASYDFFKKLSDYYYKSKGDGPLSKSGYYDILGGFAEHLWLKISNELQSFCRLDIMLHEKPKKFPQWAQRALSTDEKLFLRDFYNIPENLSSYLGNYETNDSKYLSRVTHLEIFDFNPFDSLNQSKTAILADYNRRDILGNAKTFAIPLKTV